MDKINGHFHLNGQTDLWETECDGQGWGLGLRRIGGRDVPALCPKAQHRDRDSQKEGVQATSLHRTQVQVVVSCPRRPTVSPGAAEPL